MKKKLLVLLLVLSLVASLGIGLAACNDKGDAKEIKIGLICLHDESSTYDKNFIDAMKAVQAELGLTNEQVIIATGIEEGDGCYQKACELADSGCTIIFADSFGHEPYMIKAAKKYPEVQFCHATGVKAHTEGLNNYANAFASIYEGRYLAGVAAGLKLNAMGETKMGYVGAHPYAEVISGFTSFYLGAKSVCANVTMDVTFTGSWYDETAENNAATSLIAGGCKLISQHADSMGAPNACEAAGVPNVSYNGSTKAACPNTFIVSSRINWAPYYKYVVEQVKKGEAVAKDWTGTMATDSVLLTEFGGVAPTADTATTIATVRAELTNGTRKVFDTSTFTVGGAALTTYLADVDDAGDYKGETEAIKTANNKTYFAESEMRSAPYFNLFIDGITNLDENKK